MEVRYAMIIGEEIKQILSTPYLHVKCETHVNDVTHFYNLETQSIEAKAELDLQVNVEDLAVTIHNLPANLKVETNDMEVFTDEEPLVIEYDIPGVYDIKLSGHARFLDLELEVTVGDA